MCREEKLTWEPMDTTPARHAPQAAEQHVLQHAEATDQVELLEDVADVGAQTADWFEKLKSRVDDPSSLPRHHVVLNMVDPKTTRADAALIEEALTRFPVIETVMMRRNTYKEMDQKGLLHALALEKQSDPNPLMRPHVRHVVEALEEATDILNNILAA